MTKCSSCGQPQHFGSGCKLPEPPAPPVPAQDFRETDEFRRLREASLRGVSPHPHKTPEDWAKENDDLFTGMCDARAKLNNLENNLKRIRRILLRGDGANARDRALQVIEEALSK